MNPQARRQGGMILRRIKQAGGGKRAIVRRLASLTNNSGRITSLRLEGAAAEGASLLALSAYGLKGTLPRGSRLSIASAEHSVTAETTAASGVLASVPIDPPLAAPAADGAIVEISQPYGEQTVFTMRSRTQAEREGAVETDDDQRTVGGTSWAPRTGDLYIEDGRTSYVHRVHVLGSADGVAYRLEIGEKAA